MFCSLARPPGIPQITTRTVLQIRTHAQKYFNKLSRNARKAAAAAEAAKNAAAGIAPPPKSSRASSGSKAGGSSRRSKQQQRSMQSAPKRGLKPSAPAGTAGTLPKRSTTSVSTSPARRHKKAHSLQSPTSLFVNVNFDDVGLSPSSKLLHFAPRWGELEFGPRGVDGDDDDAVSDLASLAGSRKRKDSMDSPKQTGSRKRGSFSDEDPFSVDEHEHTAKKSLFTPWDAQHDTKFEALNEAVFQFLSPDDETDPRVIGSSNVGFNYGSRLDMMESKGDDGHHTGFATTPPRHKTGLDMGSPNGPSELNEFLFSGHTSGAEPVNANDLHEWMCQESASSSASSSSCSAASSDSAFADEYSSKVHPGNSSSLLSPQNSGESVELDIRHLVKISEVTLDSDSGSVFSSVATWP